jgi:hypothetical protein
VGQELGLRVGSQVSYNLTIFEGPFSLFVSFLIPQSFESMLRKSVITPRAFVLTVHDPLFVGLA